LVPHNFKLVDDLFQKFSLVEVFCINSVQLLVVQIANLILNKWVELTGINRLNPHIPGNQLSS
jgi:hypothetical protein